MFRGLDELRIEKVADAVRPPLARPGREPDRALARLVQRHPRAEDTLKQPLVLLIGAPLPPPFGGVARYIQLLLPALARRGLQGPDRAPGARARPVRSQASRATCKNVVVEYPGAVRLAFWLLRRPRILATLLRWYARPLVRVPRYAVPRARR